MADDEGLVQQAKTAPSGDLRAFEELVVRHQDQILANCHYLTGSPDDAQDLAQEVFVKAYFGLQRYREQAKFGTWIKKIKVNHCLNFLRKNRDRTFVDIGDPVHENTSELRCERNPERDLNAMSRREAIQAVLEQMPETLRVALLLRDFDGMQYQEIADQLGLSLSAVKMRIKRAREDFRTRYAQLNPEKRNSSE